MICFVFYGYCISVFALLRRATYFYVRIENDNKSNQNLQIFFSALYTCAH